MEQVVEMFQETNCGSTDKMQESTSKTECRGRRLLIAVIVFLAVAVVVLITAIIFMQEEEIASLGGKVAELKPLRGSSVLHFYKSRVSWLFCNMQLHPPEFSGCSKYDLFQISRVFVTPYWARACFCCFCRLIYHGLL